MSGDPSQVKVRPLERPDVEAVLAIQQGLPQISQWSAGDYDLSGREEVAGWVAEAAGNVVGFVVARQVADEAEILNLAVHVFARRGGIGTFLVRAALGWAENRGARKVYLEVRASNRVALRFYEHHGWALAGRRAKYYASPTEDALVLARDVLDH